MQTTSSYNAEPDRTQCAGRTLINWESTETRLHVLPPCLNPQFVFRDVFKQRDKYPYLILVDVLLQQFAIIVDRGSYGVLMMCIVQSEERGDRESNQDMK